MNTEDETNDQKQNDPQRIQRLIDSGDLHKMNPFTALRALALIESGECHYRGMPLD